MFINLNKTLLRGTGIALFSAAVALTSNVANALPTFVGGSLAIAAFSDTTTNLATTSVFDLSGGSFGSTYLLSSGTGNFGSGINGDNFFGFVNNGANLDLSNGSTFNFTDPANVGSFVANAGPVTILPSSPGVLSFYITGNYTVGNDFANHGAIISADETFALTQTNGPGNAISISGTFQSPLVLPPGTPEPGTLGLLGAGLAALGFARRRFAR